MYLSKSSFVALSPGGVTWEATWDAILQGRRVFRRPVPGDALVDWPGGPPMGIVGDWPSTPPPDYLQRTSAMLAALARAVQPAMVRVQAHAPHARWGVVLGSSHGDPGPGAVCAEQGLEGMEACDLRRVVSADLGEAFVAQLGIDCPAWVVHGACASGLVALQVADDLLEAGVLDAVVVICADTLSRVAYAGFHRVGAMSALGSTPFDASRDGMTLSEAGAALVCTREPGPGDQVAMRSVAVNCDRSGTVEPSAAGVEAALRACLDGAATQGTEVDFVYWHGTGTRLNDEAEFGAAMRVFEGGVPPGTSTKGVLGHTMGASALINVMAACETLYCRALPGCAGMSAPAFPALNVSPAAIPVPGARNGVCVALGFGGINSAALLSRAEAPA